MGNCLSMGCGVCRIMCYTLYKKLCCIPDKKPTPSFKVICLGLSNTGKSTILAIMNQEAIKTEPTIGFNIKAVYLNNCILNVKELGGSDQVRPFWSRYYVDSQAIIFTVNASANNLDLESSLLHTVLNHPALVDLPLLIFAVHAGPNSIQRTVDQIHDELNLRSVSHLSDSKFVIQPLNSCQDLQSIRQGFYHLSELLLYSKTNSTN